MSKFSGRCDLCDHIMMEKHRTQDGSDKKEDLEKAYVLYSDEMECFKIFKERTKGVIYQSIRVPLTSFNIDKEIKYVNNPNKLSKIEHVDIVPDKRKKGGTRKKITYTYIHNGKEYNRLSDIQYYGRKEIHFETLLDIIPYYPYIISMSVSSNGEEFIVISSESFIEEQYQSFRESGISTEHRDWYRQELQKHYIDVIKNYYSGTYKEGDLFLC